MPGVEWHAKMIRVGASIAAGVLVLMISARLLRIAEFNEVMSRTLPSCHTPLKPSASDCIPPCS